VDRLLKIEQRAEDMDFYQSARELALDILDIIKGGQDEAQR
jgi:hypothetical protein